jgi:type VI secretion system protein ImpE
MTDARALLRAGDPRAALEQLKQQVRAAPRDARLRVFLFQLFCVVGEWQRAVGQLTVAAQLDPAALAMAQAYREVIRCEVTRARVFAGTRAPLIFGEPAPWMSLLVEALRLFAAGEAAAAAGLRDDAFEQAPATTGEIDGAPFAWLADADPRLGPMLEAIVDGKYYWVPCHRLRRLAIEPPADLRDRVWLPARFGWANGGETVGFVPTRYPGTEAVADPALLLAGRTEWQAQDKGAWFTGLGQRMLATDAGEHAIMDVRQIVFSPSDADPAAPMLVAALPDG